MICKNKTFLAPVIEELPMALECELVSYDKSDCRMVGKVVNVGVDESCLTPDGKVDVAKLDPITFDPVNHVYLKLGAKAGDEVMSENGQAHHSVEAEGGHCRQGERQGGDQVGS